MTEQDWLSCTDPQAMLDYLDDRVSFRKRRLFSSACCRRVWHLLTDQRLRHAVEVAERYVDGLAGAEELRAAHDAILKHPDLSIHVPFPQGGVWWLACPPNPANAPRSRNPDAEEEERTAKDASYCGDFWVEQLVPGEGERHRIAGANFVRDLLGNPFRPIAFDPTWLHREDGQAARLARTIYEQRDFHLLPVLGDALEDLGCSDERLLRHCHEGGEHARGCWVVDLCLGREPPLRPELITEEEWLTPTDDLRRMLRFLDGKVTTRQLRRFAVACCRSVWSHLEPRIREAVMVAERYLAGRASKDELQAAREDVTRLREEHVGADARPVFRAWLGIGVCFPEEPEGQNPGPQSVGPSGEPSFPRYSSQGLPAAAGVALHMKWVGGKEQRLTPYHLLIDVVGNPFRQAQPDAESGLVDSVSSAVHRGTI